MTTLFSEEVTCSVCGKKSDQTVIGSTNTLGSSDLDTRPAEMERSTISYWVQKCPTCGYCAGDLSKSNEYTVETVKSDEYQQILSNPILPEKSSHFLASSYEKEKQKSFSDAAWQAIHAAWICDDESNEKAATICREKAINLIEQANLNEQKIAEQPGASEIIQVDLMRKAGTFNEALVFLEALNSDNYEEIIVQILEFEKNLILKQDSNTYTVSDVLD